MPMRETFTSLKIYFVLAGGCGVIRSAIDLLSESEWVLKVGAGVYLAFALAFLAAGANLQKLLSGSPHLLRGLLYATMVVQVLGGVVGLVVVGDPLILVFPALALLISWYLLVNVNRLSLAGKPQESKE